MKRLTAILCLSIFLFNLYGYQLLIDRWQKSEELAFENQIHSNLQAEDLISIKVPAALPPYSDNLDSYEWVDGEVNVDGTIYKYVKRRIFRDSIEFLCVSNTARMRMENARENFFRLCTDLQASSSHENNHSTAPVKPAVFEYCSDITFYQLPCIVCNQIAFPGIYNESCPSKEYDAIEHPPENLLV